MSETINSPSAEVVVLGKIVDPYGLRGAVRVHSFTDDPALLSALSHWWLRLEADAAQEWRRIKVVKCGARSASLIATLDGVSDRDGAEGLRGMLVGALRQEFPAAQKDEYYWSDLVGLDVINTQDQNLGKVLGLIETPANDVLRVGDGVDKERLLPFVAAVVLDVDLPARRIRVDWGVDW